MSTTGAAATLAAILLAFLLSPAMAHGAATGIGDDVVAGFLSRHLGAAPGAARTLWLPPATKAGIAKHAGRAPDGARIAYWQSGARSAWILDRIGKEAPITFGVVVESGAIVALEVLAYRESRGHEIRSPRWLDAFRGARATDSGLDRTIDNITGATLSSRAARDVARLALALHQAVIEANRAGDGNRHTSTASPASRTVTNP